mgnify:CR=1 FL=1
MEEAEKIISVDQVSKVYRLYDKPIDRLLESISLRKKSYHKDFYALRDISFSVGRGEAVGIIGTNGSGKSTMLKIITGVLSATTGKVESRGSICALLELGAGFNQDYTGIENIYMNGTMMGFSREEMQRRMDDILRFADIGDFVNQPVKTYSSGMFVRLAFALAINVDPEILIVDEALSVGDVFFQAKCYRRMEEMMKNGTTILMVSHDMGSIIKYCDKVVLLNRGHFVAQGEAGKMVDLYKKILANQTDELAEALIEQKKEALGLPIGEVHTDKSMKERMNLNPEVQEYGDGRASFEDFGTLDARGNVTNLLLKGEMFTIRERIRFHAPIEMPIFTYTLRDKKGTDITGTNTMFEGADIKPVKDGDVYTVSFRQKMNLQGGEYLLSMSCTGYENGEHVVYHRLYNVLSLTVISNKNTVGYYDMDSEVEAVREEKA